MGYTFTFGNIKRICQALGMSPAKKGSKTWRGIGTDGVFRQTQIHSHGDGDVVATGIARRMAEQLGFASLEDMYKFLGGL